VKKPLIFYPFLFVLYHVLFYYSYNIKELELAMVVTAILYGLAFTSVLFLLLNQVLKNKVKTGLILLPFLFIFLNYTRIYRTFVGFGGEDHFLCQYPSILLICGALFIAYSYIIIKSKKQFDKSTKFLNVLATFLMVITLINIVTFEIQMKRYLKPEIDSTQDMETVLADSQIVGETPDIYYLIFDRYANQHILKEYYNYDNAEFINFLANKGFYIGDKSRSNYPDTYLSLASSLNLKHLVYLEDKTRLSQDETPVLKMLENNLTLRFLKNRGYKYIHLGSWWGGTKWNKYADNDLSFQYLKLNEFTMDLLRTTFLFPSQDRDRHSFHALYQFRTINEIPKIKGPKFVFAHFLMPHDPFVFKANGERATSKDILNNSRKENYLNQLKFVNQQIMKIIDNLLAADKNNPIIIIQSDEGPKGLSGKEALKIHAGILNAYYFPKKARKYLYPAITPVNTFRVLFNQLFNTSYELLIDDTFVLKNNKFINVTDKVRVRQ
jgi:hypothetical protein